MASLAQLPCAASIIPIPPLKLVEVVELACRLPRSIKAAATVNLEIHSFFKIFRLPLVSSRVMVLGLTAQRE